MQHRVLIVGGGITGLSAAYYLNRAGIRPTLIEKSARLGGVIRSERLDGCLLEAGPDSFLASKPWALDLIREAGLEGEVIGSNDRKRVTYILKNGALKPLPAGLVMMAPTKAWPVVTSKLLSWPSKVRMGLDLFRRPRGPQPDRSVHDFLMDHYGPEAVGYLAEPLLAGIFGGDPKLLSVNSVLPRFVAIEARYGSLSRGILAEPRPNPGASLFRTLKGGLSDLIAALAPSADTIVGEAQTIERSREGFRVRADGNWIEARQIFIGAPAYVAAKLLLPLNSALSALLDGIPYNSSITLSQIYSRESFGHRPGGFGFLVPQLERKQMKACTFVNNKFDFRAAGDKLVLRCFFGAESMTLSDQDLFEAADSELRAIIGLDAQPLHRYLTRWPAAMAQYTVGHQKRLERIEALMDELPGVAIGGNGYNGIGIPDCVYSGKRAAEAIAARLDGSGGM